MEVTSVNIKVTKGEEPVVAYCSIVLDEAFAVRKIRVLSKNEEFVVCMPSMKTREGKYSDVCHPITSMFRKKIVTAILNAYLGQLKSEVV